VYFQGVFVFPNKGLLLVVLVLIYTFHKAKILYLYIIFLSKDLKSEVQNILQNPNR
jgi:hypothetical protein